MDHLIHQLRVAPVRLLLPLLPRVEIASVGGTCHVPRIFSFFFRPSFVPPILSLECLAREILLVSTIPSSEIPFEDWYTPITDKSALARR